MQEQIKDTYGRTFGVLRVSLTSKCNFACQYCVPEGEELNTEAGNVLTAEQYLTHIRQIHNISPIQVVRLTGGEPLLFKDLEVLIRGIKAMGIHEVKITTNGHLLNYRLPRLINAGLDALNISLDAVDPELFHTITRRNTFHKVAEAVENAVLSGVKVKLNSVIVKGTNEDQIIPLLKFAGKHGVMIRFLELMRMGHLYENGKEVMVSQAEILDTIAQEYFIMPVQRQKSSTANYWLTDSNIKFGIIANESAPFCHDCNRLRLDSDGKIYGCITSTNGLQLNEKDTAYITKEKLRKALDQKQVERFNGSETKMISIGG